MASFYDKAAEYIKKHEGYSDKTYWDVNAYRLGYGSDTITTSKNGAFRKVVKGDVTNRDMAAIDLARRIKTEFEPRIINKVGAQTYNSLPENTKIALLSITYNYGSLPTNVANAVKSGDNTKIAQAISANAVHNQGVNAKRRNDEASLVMSAIQYAKDNPAKTIVALGAIVALTSIALYLINFRQKHK